MWSMVVFPVFAKPRVRAACWISRPLRMPSGHCTGRPRRLGAWKSICVRIASPFESAREKLKAGLGNTSMGWNKKAISYGGPVRVGFWLRTFLAAALCLAFVPVAHSREPVGGARPRAEFSRWQSRYQNHLDVRRGRWRSEVRPHIAARRMTSQILSEELKKMMTPGLRTQRLRAN